LDLSAVISANPAEVTFFFHTSCIHHSIEYHCRLLCNSNPLKFQQ
jgi:hypothetical protein